VHVLHKKMACSFRQHTSRTPVRPRSQHSTSQISHPLKSQPQPLAAAEQEVQSNGFVSKAADIYSLGVLLWEMHNGMPPYASENGLLVKNSSFPRFDLRNRENAPFSYVVVALACLSEDCEMRCVLCWLCSSAW
jgi:serine/threonine protein kinase